MNIQAFSSSGIFSSTVLINICILTGMFCCPWRKCNRLFTPFLEGVDFRKLKAIRNYSIFTLRGRQSNLVILIFDPQHEELCAKFCELFSLLNYNTMFIVIQTCYWFNKHKFKQSIVCHHYKQDRVHDKHTYNKGRGEGQMFNLKWNSCLKQAVFCQTKWGMNFCCF